MDIRRIDIEKSVEFYSICPLYRFSVKGPIKAKFRKIVLLFKNQNLNQQLADHRHDCQNNRLER